MTNLEWRITIEICIAKFVIYIMIIYGVKVFLHPIFFRNFQD